MKVEKKYQPLYDELMESTTDTFDPHEKYQNVVYIFKNGHEPTCKFVGYSIIESEAIMVNNSTVCLYSIKTLEQSGRCPKPMPCLELKRVSREQNGNYRVLSRDVRFLVKNWFGKEKTND